MKLPTEEDEVLAKVKLQHSLVTSIEIDIQKLSDIIARRGNYLKQRFTWHDELYGPLPPLESSSFLDDNTASTAMMILRERLKVEQEVREGLELTLSVIREVASLKPKRRLPTPEPTVHEAPVMRIYNGRVEPNPLAHIPLWIQSLAREHGEAYIKQDRNLIFPDGSVWLNTGEGWQLTNAFESRLHEIRAKCHYHDEAVKLMEQDLRLIEYLANGDVHGGMRWNRILYGEQRSGDLVELAKQLSKLYAMHLFQIDELEAEMHHHPDMIKKKEGVERNAALKQMIKERDRTQAFEVSKIVRSALQQGA